MMAVQKSLSSFRAELRGASGDLNGKVFHKIDCTTRIKLKKFINIGRLLSSISWVRNPTPSMLSEEKWAPIGPKSLGKRAHMRRLRGSLP
jgi:hypothetical protein